MELNMQKNKKYSSTTSKIDVESRFAESDAEYVTEDDSRQMLLSFDSYLEYSSERNAE
jgi:hypothetical protein|tara:strand:+ start:1108 stop:1281 length:174 start_codon:yes stop_codon:yes gene_type:complete